VDSFLLQDWITIRSGASTVTQSEDTWLDLSSYQDAVIWLEVREALGRPDISFQTAPIADESLFQTFIAPLALSASNSPTVLSFLMSRVTAPLARYVRWQLTYNGTSPWDATFRVHVSANSPGI
jgi:hypothetical protein